MKRINTFLAHVRLVCQARVLVFGAETETSIRRRQNNQPLAAHAVIAVLCAVMAFTHIAQADEATADGDAKVEESWQVIYIDKQRVGYGRVRVRNVKEGRTTVVKSDVEEHLTIRRFGQELKITSITHTEETEDGQLLNFTYEMRNPPLETSKSVGRMKGRFLSIDTTIGGRTSTRQIEWDPAVKSPLYEDRQLREPPLKPGDKRSFKVFMPQASRVVEIKVAADDHRTVKLHDGTQQKLLSVRITRSLLPGISTKAFLNKEGQLLRSDTVMLGMQMVTWSVSQEVALEEIKGAELDLAVNSLVRISNPPVNLHGRKSAVYRIKTTGRDPSEIVPNSESQAVKKTGDETIEVTVTTLALPRNIQPSRKEQQDYLTETSFLQVSDARVRGHARKAAAGSQDPGTVAARMEKYVYRELKKKNFSTALGSAAEVAKSLEGDCTEHACLLAAMLRAEKIPSRIVVGLVYAERFGAFGGHMWTEAWLDGKWIALDATLGRGGIGAGHLRLADSDLADEGPAPVTAFVPLLDLLNNVEINIVSTER